MFSSNTLSSQYIYDHVLSSLQVYAGWPSGKGNTTVIQMHLYHDSPTMSDPRGVPFHVPRQIRDDFSIIGVALLLAIISRGAYECTLDFHACFQGD